MWKTACLAIFAGFTGYRTAQPPVVPLQSFQEAIRQIGKIRCASTFGKIFLIFVHKGFYEPFFFELQVHFSKLFPFRKFRVKNVERGCVTHFGGVLCQLHVQCTRLAQTSTACCHNIYNSTVYYRFLFFVIRLVHLGKEFIRKESQHFVDHAVRLLSLINCMRETQVSIRNSLLVLNMNSRHSCLFVCLFGRRFRGTQRRSRIQSTDDLVANVHIHMTQ